MPHVVNALATRAQRQALLNYEQEVRFAQSLLRSAATFPTEGAVLEAIRVIERTALSEVQKLAITFGQPVPPVADWLAAHRAGIFEEARRMLARGKAAGLTGPRVRRDIARMLAGDAPPLRDYGLVLTDISALRTFYNDAKRIVVDQGFAMGRRYIVQTLRDLGFRRAPWVLSDRHVTADVCDELAAGGPYLLSEWPDPPHVLCGCYPGDPEP